MLSPAQKGTTNKHFAVPTVLIWRRVAAEGDMTPSVASRKNHRFSWQQDERKPGRGRRAKQVATVAPDSASRPRGENEVVTQKKHFSGSLKVSVNPLSKKADEEGSSEDEGENSMQDGGFFG